MPTIISNNERAVSFAGALGMVPAAFDAKESVLCAFSSHVRLTGTHKESASSQRSDFVLNMMHYLVSQQPQLIALHDVRDSKQLSSALRDVLKTMMGAEQPGTVLEKVCAGLPIFLASAGECADSYLEFKLFDFVIETEAEW